MTLERAVFVWRAEKAEPSDAPPPLALLLLLLLLPAKQTATGERGSRCSCSMTVVAAAAAATAPPAADGWTHIQIKGQERGPNAKVPPGSAHSIQPPPHRSAGPDTEPATHRFFHLAPPPMPSLRLFLDSSSLPFHHSIPLAASS
eukprot:GHVU01006201.1.p1 GENE.GHVU01006201.1~~GHVU01006201.1.p1  ORF type:complete len:145 (-),score=22.53 GHVU01006201.1:172-606(-)